MDGRLLALGTVAAVAVAGVLRRRGSRAVAYTGYNCPILPAGLIEWAVGNWWYPTPSEELTWQQFVAAVQLDPDEVDAIDYLPWKRSWEPWKRFLARTEPQFHESFHRATLPSGQVAYVWTSSGVEHFFTEGGDLDPEREDEILTVVYEDLENLEAARKVLVGVPRSVVDEYSTGGCLWLALALHDRYGWPIWAQMEGKGTKGEYVAHAYNVMPDGREIDILGPQEKVDLFALGEPILLNPESIRASDSPGDVRRHLSDADQTIDKYILPKLTARKVTLSDTMAAVEHWRAS